MDLSTAQLTAWIGSYLWPLFRIGAMLMAAPFFSSNSVPMEVRLLLSLAVTALVVPIMPEQVPVDPFTWPAIGLIAQQLLIGIAMGLSLQLVFGAVMIAGALIATQMGLAMAAMVDPQNGMQVPVLGQMYTMLTTLLFLIFDTHLLLIELIVESFHVVPIAVDGLTRGSFLVLAEWGTQMFAGGLWIALPAVASLLVVNLAFGVMARAAPQLQIFAIGFPIATIMGYLVILYTLPTAVPQTRYLFDSGFDLIRRILEGG